MIRRDQIRPNSGLPAVLLVWWMAVAAGVALTAPWGAWAAEAAGSAAANSDARPTAEALLVRGVRGFEGSDMRVGLRSLEEALRLRPGWPLARTSVAAAVLRSGQFGRARSEYSALLGEAEARALASGDLAASELPPATDADVLFGLAVSYHFLGNHREAERLYRAYADLVGPTSREAGRAYARLAEMIRAEDIAWGDADAEEAKALAVDPRIASAPLVPDFPVLEEHAELIPYLRPIELAPGRAQSPDAYESLPVLARWEPTVEETVAGAGAAEDTAATEDSTAVADSTTAADSAPVPGYLTIEILVDTDGLPSELAAPGEDGTPDDLATEFEAVRTWRFDPAVASSGVDTLAWIAFEIDVLRTPGAGPVGDSGAAGTGEEPPGQAPTGQEPPGRDSPAADGFRGGGTKP